MKRSELVLKVGDRVKTAGIIDGDGFVAQVDDTDATAPYNLDLGVGSGEWLDARGVSILGFFKVTEVNGAAIEED